jgi:hypothetical protein
MHIIDSKVSVADCDLIKSKLSAAAKSAEENPRKLLPKGAKKDQFSK